MTCGSPAKLMLRFALPLLIGNIFQQLYNLVDSVVVGNFVGADALAAVGSCSHVNFLFFSLSSGLATGIGIIISQYYGAGDEKNVSVTISNSVYVLVGASLIVSIISILLAEPLLRLLQTPEGILRDSVIYMQTTCAGLIATALYNGVAAILRSLGDSTTPLYFLILSSIINVVLDLAFVLLFHWGVFGVAFATIIAQGVSAVISIIYAYRHVPQFRLTREQMAPKPEIIRRSFALGFPLALQNSLIAISGMMLQGVINSFGETIIAANTVITRVEQVVQQPYGSLSVALTTYTGQNIGAGKHDRVKQGYNQSVLTVLIFSLLLIPVIFLFGEQIIGFFVNDPEVIRIGVIALRINSFSYFALGMIYVPRSLLNGSGDTKFSMINGITEIICRIGYSNILTRIPLFGYWGIWLTTCATRATTAIVCVIRYKKGLWKEKNVID